MSDVGNGPPSGATDPTRRVPETGPPTEVLPAKASPSPESSAEFPFYGKWWLWSALGTLLLVSIGLSTAALAGSSSSTGPRPHVPIKAAPSTTTSSASTTAPPGTSTPPPSSATTATTGTSTPPTSITGPPGPAGVSGYVMVQGSVQGSQGTPGPVATTARCPTGKKAISGGADARVTPGTENAEAFIETSAPTSDGSGWQASAGWADLVGGVTVTLVVTAICAYA